MQTSSMMSVSEPLPPQAAQGASLSLLERMGGMPRVHHLVDWFIDELESNGEVAALLAGIDLTAFKKAQVAFFTEAFGGHVPDASTDTRVVHAHPRSRGVSQRRPAAEYDLLSLGLSDELHEELVLAVAARALASSAL